MDLEQSGDDPYPREFGARHGATLLLIGVVVLGAPAFELCHGVWPGKSLHGPFAWEAIRRSEVLHDAEKNLENDAELPKVARPYYLHTMFTLFDQAVDKVTVGRDGWLFLTSAAQNYPPADARARLPQVLDAISDVAHWFESEGSAVEIMIVPTKATMAQNKLPTLYPPFRPSYDDVIDGLRERGVNALDLRDVLVENGVPLYFKTDTHWTSQGALAAARKMAARLRERYGENGLPGDPIEGILRELEPKHRDGDLTAMLGFSAGPAELKDMARPITIGADPVTRQLIELKGAEKIVHIGTSYSNSYYLDSLMSALLGRCIRDTAVPGKSPVLHLLVMARDHIANHALLPELVIWEFPERYFFLGAENSVLSPLLNLMNGAKFMKGTREPLDFSSIKAYSIKFRGVANNVAVAEATSTSPQVMFTLSKPLPGDGSCAVAYQVDPTVPTTTRVWFDSGRGFNTSERYSTQLIDTAAHLIVAPIMSHDHHPVTSIRIDPVNDRCGFTIHSIEIWTR